MPQESTSRQQATVPAGARIEVRLELFHVDHVFELHLSPERPDASSRHRVEALPRSVITRSPRPSTVLTSSNPSSDNGLHESARTQSLKTAARQTSWTSPRGAR